MKKAVSSFIILFLFSLSSFGQHLKVSPSITDNLIKQANRFAHLVQNRDTVEFIEKVYPRLITLIGDKNKVIQLTAEAYTQLAKEGMFIDSVMFLQPYSIIDTAGELQTTMTEVSMMTIPKGKMITKSTVIAISRDKGITWYFLDTTGKDLKEMKEIFPNLSSRLIIAPKEKPAVFRD